MEPGSNQSVPFNPYYSSQVGEPAGIINEAQYPRQMTPYQPIPGMHSVQMTTLNPLIPYTQSMNNFQTPGMRPVTVTSPPRNSRNSGQGIWKDPCILMIILIYLFFITVFCIILYNSGIALEHVFRIVYIVNFLIIIILSIINLILYYL